VTSVESIFRLTCKNLIRNLLRTALSTQVVEQLLQLGYERETIKTLMKERVKNYARGYATINEALDDLLNMQPDLIDLGSMSSHSSSGSSIQSRCWCCGRNFVKAVFGPFLANP